MRTPHRKALVRGCSIALVLLSACGEAPPVEYRLSGPTMGTTFNVTVVARAGFDREGLTRQVHAALDDVDRHMSTWREEAELATLNRSSSTGWIAVSQRLCDALEDGLRLSAATGGTFDMTVGPLVDLWGFGPGNVRTAPPADESIAEALSRTGHDKLQVDCQRPAIRKAHAELKLDLSAFAKGLAADEVAALLDANGMSNYLVEIGGDLVVRGRNASGEKWRIAIETPDGNGRQVERIVRVSDIGVATSGDYRNFFEFEGRRYSHTINPRTGRPVEHDLASVTVLGESAAFADAMATALLVLGPEAGPHFAHSQQIAAYFIMRNTDGFTGKTNQYFDSLTTE